MSTAESAALPAWKTELINHCLSSKILTFGSFELKSKRISPYFFNCGLFSKAHLIRAISTAYANTLAEHGRENAGWTFDVLFGPAYKGIPLCATTAEKLAGIDEQKFGQVGYAFNRKEVKDHGEGGLIVGESLKGKKVVIIDDVMTAGTAIRESIDVIREQGGELVGIIVAVNRQEKMPTQSEKEGRGDDGSERGSAIGQVRRDTGVPVLAVLSLTDIVAAMKGLGRHEEVKQMQDYYARFGTQD